MWPVACRRPISWKCLEAGKHLIDHASVGLLSMCLVDQCKYCTTVEMLGRSCHY